MGKRGIDLLLGNLNRTDDSLDTAPANEDEYALIVASDPLVTVTAILIRMLRVRPARIILGGPRRRADRAPDRKEDHRGPPSHEHACSGCAPFRGQRPRLGRNSPNISAARS